MNDRFDQPLQDLFLRRLTVWQFVRRGLDADAKEQGFQCIVRARREPGTATLNIWRFLREDVPGDWAPRPNEPKK